MPQQTVVVHKRWGNEESDVREFVRPDSYPTWKLSTSLHDPVLANYIENCRRYVTQKVRMAPGNPNIADWHKMSAYGNGILNYYETDFWNYPGETIAQGIGDCDDKSILLVSLLRRRMPPTDVYCTIGKLGDLGHMWVSIRAKGGFAVIETTVDTPMQMEGQPYYPYFRFNDKNVQLSRPLNEIPMLHGTLGGGY